MPLMDTVKRITTDEFKEEDREVAERIGSVYNYFAEQVTNILNGRIDSANLGRPIISLTVSTDNNGKPLKITQFSNKIGMVGTKVLRAVNTTNVPNYLQNAPFLSFTAEGTGLYTIDNITGLNPNEEYVLAIELVF